MPLVSVPKVEEFLAEATRNVAAGLSLNWGENWDGKMRDEVVAHLLKVAKVLDGVECRNKRAAQSAD